MPIGKNCPTRITFGKTLACVVSALSLIPENLGSRIHYIPKQLPNEIRSVYVHMKAARAFANWDATSVISHMGNFTIDFINGRLHCLNDISPKGEYHPLINLPSWPSGTIDGYFYDYSSRKVYALMLDVSSAGRSYPDGVFVIPVSVNGVTAVSEKIAYFQNGYHASALEEILSFDIIGKYPSFVCLGDDFVKSMDSSLWVSAERPTSYITHKHPGYVEDVPEDVKIIEANDTNIHHSPREIRDLFRDFRLNYGFYSSIDIVPGRNSLDVVYDGPMLARDRSDLSFLPYFDNPLTSKEEEELDAASLQMLSECVKKDMDDKIHEEIIAKEDSPEGPIYEEEFF